MSKKINQLDDGVTKIFDKYYVNITLNGVQHFIGRCTTLKEAADLYENAKADKNIIEMIESNEFNDFDF